MTTVKDISDTYGLTMIDSAKPLDVHVTPGDIRKAKPHDQTGCAIAHAVRRETRAKNVYVLRSTVWVDDGKGHLVRYGLPPSLQKEIVSFDRNKDFRPGDYHLSPARNLARNRAQRAGRSPQKEQRVRAKKRRARGAEPRRVHRSEGVRSTELHGT